MKHNNCYYFKTFNIDLVNLYKKVDLIKCPVCGLEYEKDKTKCPYCGTPRP